MNSSSHDKSLGDPYHWVDLERPGKLGGVRDLAGGPVPYILDLEDAAGVVLLLLRHGHLVVLALGSDSNLKLEYTQYELYGTPWIFN